MSIPLKYASLAIAACLALLVSAQAQTGARGPRAPAASPESRLKDQLNAWTLGLAGGLLEGAPLRFAVELARVVDDNENLHVLPIVTRGPAENVEALLYLKGVDAAIINADALAQFRTLVPD